MLSVVIAAGLSTSLYSCKSQEEKDKETKAKIEAAAPGVSVTVNNGVATITGQVNDDAAKAAMEETVKKVDGVKSVVNSLDVPPPPVINPDQQLIDAANTIVAKYQGVMSSVVNGVVTLTGEIKRADLPNLMSEINSIGPKSVENKLTVK